MSIIRLALTTILILSLFYACKKDDLPNQNNQLLQRMIFKSGDSILYTFFNYDAQNRLAVITDSSNNGQLWKTFIEYNPLDKPTKFKVLYRNNPTGSFIESSDSLLYNNDKQVVKKLFTSYSINPYKTINTYNYDAQGRLINDTIYDYWSDQVFGYTTFTYDRHNNIIQWQDFYKSSGEMISPGIITASYNMESNAYKSLGLAVYFIRDDNFLLNEQNRTQVNYYDGSIDNYQYEYYSNRLPKKAVITYTMSSWSFVNNVEFFYN